MRRATEFSRLHPFYLKMDIHKFYDSIDLGIMLDLLARRIKDRPLLELFRRLLESYCTAPGKGLPIGNLTSQYFGNVYLDEFDHWMKETRRQLEQQRQELPFGEPQQEQSVKHEQQHRVPLRSARQYRGRDSG